MLTYRKPSRSWIKAAAAVAVAGGLIATAARGQEPVGSPDSQIQNAEPTTIVAPRFMVHAGVNRESRLYQDGEELLVSVRCEEEAYLYVVYEQADGRQFLIFPNAAQPKNKIPKGEQVQFPAKDDRFRWVVTSPFGKERVRVIASKMPLKTLADSRLRKQRFNPLPEGVSKGIRTELCQVEHRDNVAEDVVEIESRPATAPNTAPNTPSTPEPSPAPTTAARNERTPKRLGVFFGVSRYEFDAECRESKEGRGLNLSSCEKDAQELARVMQTQGRLDAVQVFTNERATRQNLELAVTKWLATESRPGDTVVFYFSGHGTVVPDENGDEADHLDELILPYDFVPPPAVEAYLRKHKANELSPEQTRRLDGWVRTLRGEGDKINFAHLALETAVSDDLFGHWLQRLSGRRIIVMLDSCFSGGFAAQEKGDDSEPVASFDFLEGELVRLKDIDQPETALLTASRASQIAFVHVSGELSVMTHFMIQLLQGAPAAVTLEESHAYCAQQMREYFAALNEALSVAGKPPVRPHQPMLTNFCSNHVLLKP